jgi:uncharacterized membrane protein YcjF (UPF0283 family)
LTSRVITPCEYARERHRNIAMWRNLWTILLFAFGAAVVVFLVLATVLFIRQDWLPAAFTTLGALVEGPVIKWVAGRRAEAVKEEEEAYNDVKKECGDTSAADGFRAKQKIFGRFR